MAEFTERVAISSTKPESNVARRFVGTVFGLVEVTLATRLIFKLLGANPANALVSGVYAITRGFVGLFEGIFSPVATPGAETVASFEPATFIAMLAVAVVAWVLFKLITPSTGSQAESASITKQDG